MAEASAQGENAAKVVIPKWANRVSCRYYMHGVCRNGEDCCYSHDRASFKPQMVCTYYQQGECTYGDKCRYDHIRTKTKGRQPAAPMKPLQLTKSRLNDGQVRPKFTSLRKGSCSDKSQVQSPPPDQWVKADVFVPGKNFHGKEKLTYSGVAQTGVEPVGSVTQEMAEVQLLGDKSLVCPYFTQGKCPYEEACSYTHGDPCDFCGQNIMHPSNTELNKSHIEECIKLHEADMEESFALQSSIGKSCGICMDVVLEKNPPAERRFGILESCNHIYCLSCIRKWRSAKQFENKIVRACPECRVKSDFVTPSSYWYDNVDEKKKLITEYKEALSLKSCKYFQEGKGECPFNEKCFYLHAYPDGTIEIPKPRKPRQRKNQDGVDDIIGQMLLWDFLQEREYDMDELLDDLIFAPGWYSSDDDSSISGISEEDLDYDDDFFIL